MLFNAKWTLLLCSLTIAVDPWPQWLQHVETVNPCYKYQARTSNQKANVAIQTMSTANTGSMVLCPCMGQLCTINSGLAQKQVILDNMNADDRNVNDRFAEAFVLPPPQSPSCPNGRPVDQTDLQQQATMDRYNFKLEQLDYWALFFAFKEEIQLNSGGKTMHRYIGGPFTFAQSMFDNRLLIPAKDDDSFKNASELVSPQLDVSQIWISHSVSLCYDILTTALAYEHSPESPSIAPSAPPPTPDFALEPSMFTWVDECTSADCGFPNIDYNERISCPGQHCQWCYQFNGIPKNEPYSIRTMFASTDGSGMPNWEIQRPITWGELSGPAAELDARTYCAQMEECTGYYWGQSGGCISTSNDPIIQDISQFSRDGGQGQAYNILPNTFYKFMRKSTYTEADVEINVNGAHGIQVETRSTHIFALSPCVDGNCTPAAPGYRPMPGYHVQGSQNGADAQDMSTEQCAEKCDTEDSCVAFDIENDKCRMYSTDHVVAGDTGPLVYIKSIATTFEFEDADACKLSCLPETQCESCVQQINGKWYNVSVGVSVKSPTQRWARIGTDSAGYCRRMCWDDETCLAWTWSGATCEHLHNFKDVAYGMKPNMNVVRALGFSDSIPCPNSNELYDLCTGTCVNLHNHMEAGWCNHNWVNCNAGPFANADRPGVHLCTGSALYVDNSEESPILKAHVPDDNNGQVLNPPLAAKTDVTMTVQNYGSRTITGAFEADETTGCALGAGHASVNLLNKDFSAVDTVMDAAQQAQALNFIAKPDNPTGYRFQSAWGSNESTTDCTLGGCRFGTCVLKAQGTTMRSFTSSTPTNIQANVATLGLINQLQYQCPTTTYTMNAVEQTAGDNLWKHSVLNFKTGGNNFPCCSGKWDENAPCNGDMKLLLDRAEPPPSCSQGLYHSNTRLVNPNKKTSTRYQVTEDNMDILPSTFCQALFAPSISVEELKGIGILDDKNLPQGSTSGNVEGSRQTASAIEYMCPVGVTTAKGKDDSAPFTERVKGSVAQLTLKCPFNKKFKRTKITPVAGSVGRCRYGVLNDNLEAVPNQASTTKQYDYNPFSESPWIGAAMQYAAKCVRYDFECLEEMPEEKDVCGVSTTGTCGLSDNGQSAHSAQAAIDKCNQLPMEMCPLPGYGVKWTNGTLGCVPIGSTGVFSADVNTDGTPFWPGFVQKKGSNAGIGPAWFDRHSKCSNADKCGGIGDCGAPVSQTDDVLKHIDQCQKGLTDACCNEQAYHDPVVVAQTGQCPLESCISKPSMQCLGGQWQTCPSQSATCNSATQNSCCTCKPECKSTKQSQTTQLVTIGHSEGNVCGTSKTHLAQSVAWGTGTTSVLACNGEADMTAGALWRGGDPPCGCDLDLQNVFRLQLSNVPALTVGEAISQAECYYRCDTDSTCYGCAKHNEGTWHMAMQSGDTVLQQFTVYKKQPMDQPAPCCDPKLSCAYAGADTGNCPPHAIGCGNGGSVCDTPACEKCVCVCEEGFVGPYCDQCRDPNKDPASKCTTCLGNYMPALNGECILCKTGFTIESKCTECETFVGPPGKCDVNNCTTKMSGSTVMHDNVVVGYDMKAKKQLFDGTKGIPFGVIPIGVQYSVITDTVTGTYYWFNSTHKSVITDMQVQPFFQYTIGAQQLEWFDSIPIGTDTTRVSIIQDMSITGYVCPNLGTESKTDTAFKCAESCAQSQACVAWFFDWKKNACQISTNIDTQTPGYTFGALHRSYACSNGGVVGSGPERDRMTTNDAYFSNTDTLTLQHLMNTYVVSFENPTQMYYIGTYRRYKMASTCSDGTSAMYKIAITCNNVDWSPVKVRQDWLQSIILAPGEPLDTCSNENLENFVCEQQTSPNDYALQVSPNQFVVDPSKAIYTESMPSTTACCVSCNNMFSTESRNTLRYWGHKGTTCTCYESIKSNNVPFMQPATSSHVISECDTNTSVTGELYTPWDRSVHPNGCNPRVFMTDALEYQHSHCLDDDKCKPLHSFSNIPMFACKESCIDDPQCTSVEWNNSTCLTFQCLPGHKYPIPCDDNFTYHVAVKTGGCVPSIIGGKDACVQKKLTGEYVGTIQPGTCTAYGDDVTTHNLQVHVQLGAQKPVEVQTAYTCEGTMQNATWSTMPIVPSNDNPVVISDLTDAFYFYDNLHKGTTLITGLPGNYITPEIPTVLNMELFTAPLSTVFTVNMGDNQDDQMKIEQFIPHAQLQLSGDSACFQQAELQLQQTLQGQTESTQCIEDVCVKTTSSIDDYINHFLDTLESLQQACHMQTIQAHTESARAGWFIAQAPRNSWSYSEDHKAFIPNVMLAQQMDMGPAPTPAPGAPTPVPTPQPTPLATATPTPAPSPVPGQLIVGPCIFKQMNNSSINNDLNWKQGLLPTILQREQGDCKECAVKCYDNPICSLLECNPENNTQSCILYSLSQGRSLDVNLKSIAFVLPPEQGCTVNNVDAALEETENKTVYVKQDCCI